ncbi:MAG TPA: transglutaminaseTgpA domain-containing protein, partial [Actinomycetota bacterium]
MAHPSGTSARAHRLIGLVATALLAITTALAFARVFLGLRATIALVATAVASAAIAVAFERRSLLLATLASAAGVAIAVGLAAFPDTTWYGLPTSDTLRAALDAAGVVGEQARIQVAPAEPIAPLLLAAVVSLWAAIFSAHALAFRAGSPHLGLIPPVALVAFADTVLEQFVKPLYGLAFLGAALLVVFADGLSRVQGWGPIWTSSRRGVAATAGRGARRLAATALAAGLVAPVIVPGFGSKAVIDFGAAAGDELSVDPFVSVQNELTRGTPVPVLEVRSPQALYLRLLSLPLYDGTGWRPDPNAAGAPLLEGGIVPTVEGAYGEQAYPVEVEVRNDLATRWLPVMYPTRSIEAPGSITYDRETGTAFVEPLREGDAYRFVAAPVTASADVLRGIDVRPGFGEPDPANPYLTLPTGMPPEVAEIADRWTRDAETVFDKALAIQDRLRSGFAYDPKASLGSGPHTIVTFLQRARAGFCQQFAASMAVLLRTLNIPSRVVVGYASGPTSLRPEAGWTVRSDQLHAWVEVRFPGIGWMPFEPTPERTNPAVVAYARPDPTCDEPPCGEAEPPGGAETPVTGREAQQGLNDPTPVTPQRPPRFGGGSGPLAQPSGISARMLLLLGVALGGVVFLLLPVARAVRRRARLRRAAAEPR